ncbi:AAA family ATPase [Psychrobacillus sp. NPDC058041]|uniref:ATP-binding protein n=1 Tax=Psychrobacillus sp. NPDC058041 TaxID=3346310 RepID=UPI0036D8B413
MRIEKLHIYGFGKHENVQIDLALGMNVFYGENEAGKSTIQQFILHILFGFPQKNAQLLRYEPKSGASYGGRIQLIDKQFGRVVIERVKGKASGDVALYFEDGTRGGERELESLLHSYKRTDFEAIFSFSLLQLQGFEKMTEEELTRTLLSSGTTGMDTLSNVEAQFVKEMGELFKPSGKKPIINQKIEEIKALEDEWKSHLEEVNKYETSTKRIKEIDLLLDKSNKQENLITAKLQRFMQWKQLKPIKEKQIEIRTALERVQHQTFPTDGIRRFESIKDKEMNVKISTEQLSENLKKLTNSSSVMSLDQLDSIQTFLTYETEWHQLKANRVQLEEEHTKTLQNQMQQLALIGIDWEKNLNDIVSADISLHQEEKLVSLLKKREQLESELQQEKRLFQMKSEDLRLHSARLKELKHTKSSSTEKNILNFNNFIFSGIIFLLGLILSFLQSNWLIGLTFLIVSVIVFIGFQRLSQQPSDTITYENLLKKEEQTLLTQISQLENTIQELEKENQEIEQEMQSFLKRYHLNNQVSPNLLKELFNRLRIIQEQQIQLDQMEKKLYGVRNRMQELFLQAKNIVNISLIEDMLFHQLRDYYLSEKKKLDENESMLNKIRQITLKQEENNSLLHAYAQNIQELFQEAKIETEQDFYTAYNLFEQKLSLENEYKQMQIQLGDNGVVLEEFNATFESESKKQLDELKNIRNELVEEKASLQYKTNKLLVEDHQSEILQKKEQKKAELQEYVKRWAAYKSVVEAIKQMMVQLKEERLPEVLEKAQDYFKLLTGGAYERLVLTPDGSFEAIKANGQRFMIMELSQATKEQAYISLRIALAQSLKNTAPFPIIMDDPFVHFDRFRLQQVVQLMQELQKEQQLLYFSCHDNMQYVWKEAHVVQVATYKPEVEEM